jgi:type II secretory pathway pseudopilin PulG
LKTRSALAAGAALGVLAASAFAGEAQARPVHHHHVRAAAGSDDDELKLEVQELREQVHALEGRLDSQSQGQQQAQAQAQAAQSQAQAAQAQAQAAQLQAQTAQAQIQTLPTQVATEVKKDTPKKGWEANTKVGATMFGDISNINAKSDGVDQANNGTNYDIKRFYIIIDHKFNNVFSANVTTDFNYDSGPAAATQLYLKKAYLQAKLSDALVIRLGSADLPWVPFVEGVYGYRYVENVLIDRTKFGTSADWGVHVLGSLNNGMFNYAVSAVDGSGYKKPAIGTANRTDYIDLEGRANVNIAHFTAAVGGYTGKLGKEIAGVQTYHTAQRFDALLAYTDKRMRVGGEYFYAKDWNDVLQPDPAKTNSSDGYSVFASYNFTPKVAVFGRYDWVKPKRSTTPGETDNYFNVGVSYEPIQVVDFALLYKRDKVDDGLFSTSNGVIGGVKSGTYDEVGLFTQVKF